jgi:glyoxylase-like metal-dependent hydrolase (beta-lactamase superfamily II)
VSLAVDRYELGPLGTNCYVVRASHGATEAVIIDPGDDVTELRLELARAGASCVAILVTHTHYDHIGGIADLAEASGAPVWISNAEAFVLENPDAVYAAFGVPHIRPWKPARRLDGDEQFELAGITWQTVPVPGHSPGHLAFAADGALFSGDVLFAGSVGRVDLPGGDWETLLDSISRLADGFPPETVVYSGHGPPTTLGAELEHNPFLAELRAAR